jgi:hypothetical protein
MEALPQFFRSTLTNVRNFRGFSHVFARFRTTLQTASEVVKCHKFQWF